MCVCVYFEYYENSKMLCKLCMKLLENRMGWEKAEMVKYRR